MHDTCMKCISAGLILDIIREQTTCRHFLFPFSLEKITTRSWRFRLGTLGALVFFFLKTPAHANAAAHANLRYVPSSLLLLPVPEKCNACCPYAAQVASNNQRASRMQVSAIKRSTLLDRHLGGAGGLICMQQLPSSFAYPEASRPGMPDDLLARQALEQVNTSTPSPPKLVCKRVQSWRRFEAIGLLACLFPASTQSKTPSKRLLNMC